MSIATEEICKVLLNFLGCLPPPTGSAFRIHPQQPMAREVEGPPSLQVLNPSTATILAVRRLNGIYPSASCHLGRYPNFYQSMESMESMNVNGDKHQLLSYYPRIHQDFLSMLPHADMFKHVFLESVFEWTMLKQKEHQ